GHDTICGLLAQEAGHSGESGRRIISGEEFFGGLQLELRAECFRPVTLLNLGLGAAARQLPLPGNYAECNGQDDDQACTQARHGRMPVRPAPELFNFADRSGPNWLASEKPSQFIREFLRGVVAAMIILL